MRKFYLLIVIMIIAVVLMVSEDVIIEGCIIKNAIKKYEISLKNLSNDDISMMEFYDGVKKISTKEFQNSILMKSFFNHYGADLLKMSNDTYEKTVQKFNENMRKQFGLVENNSIKLSEIYFNEGEVDYKELEKFFKDGDVEIKFEYEMLNLHYNN